MSHLGDDNSVFVSKVLIVIDIILLFMIQNTQVKPCCITVYGKILDLILDLTFISTHLNSFKGANQS